MTLNRGSIYLSGGMEHSLDGGAGWRERTSQVLRQKEYYPIDIAAMDHQYCEQHGEVFSDFGKGNEGLLRRKANIRKHFVSTDLQLIINDSDALIVYYDESVRRGAGTIAECQVGFMYDLPIFIVCDWEDWLTELPGWLHAISTKVFTTFDDLYTYLDRLPYGVIKRDVYGNHRSDDYYLCSLSGEPFKKSKTHFVSRISPLYNNQSVEIVKQTHEEMEDRYQFFKQLMNSEET